MAEFSETSAFETVSGIDNGDPLNATELNNAPKKITNRTKYLRDHTESASSVTTKMLSLMQAFVSSANIFLPHTSGIWLYQTGVGAQGLLVLEPGLHPGVTVTQIRLHLTGKMTEEAAGHSDIPATKPDISFVEVDPDGSATNIGTQADTSANVGAYDSKHEIVLTVSKLIAANKRYIIAVRGEAGSDAVANTTAFLAVDISWTAPANES